jgi:hypothetical protein
MLKVEDTAEPSHTRGVNGLGEVQGTRTGALRLPFREDRPERFALRRKLLQDLAPQVGLEPTTLRLTEQLTTYYQ